MCVDPAAIAGVEQFFELLGTIGICTQEFRQYELGGFFPSELADPEVDEDVFLMVRAPHDVVGFDVSM